MLREIEIAAAKMGNVTFVSPEHTSATWSLPSSITDCRAVGVTRTLDCMCNIQSLDGICPVGSLIRQRDRVLELSRTLGVSAETLPTCNFKSGGG